MADNNNKNNDNDNNSLKDNLPSLSSIIRTSRETVSSVTNGAKDTLTKSKDWVLEHHNTLSTEASGVHQKFSEVYARKKEYRDYVLGGVIVASTVVSIRRGIFHTVKNIVLFGGATGLALYPDYVFHPRNSSSK